MSDQNTNGSVQNTQAANTTDPVANANGNVNGNVNGNINEVNQFPSGINAFPAPPPMFIDCPDGTQVLMPPPPIKYKNGTQILMPPPPPPTADDLCGTKKNDIVNYVLPVIGILFSISLFAIYIYLLTSRKKKKVYKEQSYSLPKMSMAIDDRELIPSNQSYNSAKLGGTYKSQISDYELYKNPMAANSYSSFTVVPQYNNPGYMGNVSGGPYMGTQPVMIDPLYETSMNYPRNGQRGNPNRNRYAGSDIGTSADPIPNIMLSPIEPSSFNMNSNKPY